MLFFFKMSVSCFISQECIYLCTGEGFVLRCGHLYHRVCLQLQLDTKSSCPKFRSAVTADSFVQKLYPSDNEVISIVYNESFDETRCVFESYDDKNKSLKEKFVERVADLEDKNF